MARKITYIAWRPPLVRNNVSHYETTIFAARDICHMKQAYSRSYKLNPTSQIEPTVRNRVDLACGSGAKIASKDNWC